ncbi:DUF1707 domain-containing protein [Streptosporangium vulgare]|uniref:DUF1707 SHOCT-like domain-containing protein n=1 Tax=Streptosporangium vulgare TaxID=46190 RepID=UPI0031E02704
MTSYDPVLRASDADRDHVAAVLGEAFATGRLTSVEHADRLAAAYTAVTTDDLVPITRDLPDVTAPARGVAPRAAGGRRRLQQGRARRALDRRTAHRAARHLRRADRRPVRRGAAGPGDHP